MSNRQREINMKIAVGSDERNGVVDAVIEHLRSEGHEVSWWGPLSESSLGVVGTRGAMIVGRDGVVRKRLADGEEQVVDVSSAMDVDPAGKTGVANPRETIQQHFFRCVESGIEPLTDAAGGRRVLAIMAAAQLAAQRRASVTLDEVEQGAGAAG